MAANLKGRLSRIRKLGLVKATQLGEASGPGRVSPPLGREREAPSFLKGWEGAGRMVWARRLRFEDCLPASVDPTVFAPLRRPLAASSAARASGADSPESESQKRVASDRLRFFDLETTGLSGGTGTIAFLAAVGRIVEGDFEIEQVFLEDYPGERDFLERLLPLLSGDAVLVSYNGKAFDMPLLRTRCVMNGLAPPEHELHIDALYASRRLWRRVHGGASLGLLEREVLGLERAEDLPGELIPGAWLDFARTGDNPLMRLVMSHNADDVAGLARLFATAQAAFDNPRLFATAQAASDDPLPRAASPGLDRFGLGRTLIAAGRTGEGEELLEAAAGEGDEAAGLALLRRYRRERRLEDCLRVEPTLPRTYRSAIERAKLFERSARDLDQASRWAKEALRLAAREAERAEARRRIERLERKKEKD